MPENNPPRFACSLNFGVIDHLNTRTGKINKENINGWRAFNSTWIEGNYTIAEIAEAVEKGASLTAANLGSDQRVKGEQNFISGGLLIYDVDSGWTLNQAIACSLVKNHAGLIYLSPSHTDENHRFRIVIGLQEPITDPEFFRFLVKEVAKELESFDFRATDPSRLFFGCKPGMAHSIVHKNETAFFPKTAVALYQEKYDQYLEEVAARKELEVFDEALIAASVDEAEVSLYSVICTSVSRILDGATSQITDRSQAVWQVVQETTGWANFLSEQGISFWPHPRVLQEEAYDQIYRGDPDNLSDLGKLDRIIGKDTDKLRACKPAVSIHSFLEPYKILFKIDKNICKRILSAEDFRSIEDEFKRRESGVFRQDVKKADFLISGSRSPEKLPEIKQSLEAAYNKTLSAELETPLISSATKTKEKPSYRPPIDYIRKQNAKGDTYIAGVEPVSIVTAFLWQTGNPHGAESLLFDATSEDFYRYHPKQKKWIYYSADVLKQNIQAFCINNAEMFDCLEEGYQCKLPVTATAIREIYDTLKIYVTKDNPFSRNHLYSFYTNGYWEIFNNRFVLDDDYRKLYPRETVDFALPTAPQNFANVEAFFKRSLGNDDKAIEVIYAFMAAMIKRVDLQKFLFLYGVGGSGKSTTLSLFEALAGRENTASTAVKFLENSQFETSKFVNKKLITMKDTNQYMKNPDVIKQLTGGDSVSIEYKFVKNVRNTHLNALLVMAGNEIPTSSDMTSGFDRRPCLIGFNNAVAAKNQRTLLKWENIGDKDIKKATGELADDLGALSHYLLHNFDEDRIRRVIAEYTTEFKTEKDCAQRIEQLLSQNKLAPWLSANVIISPDNETVIQAADDVAYKPMGKGLDMNLYANYCQFAKSAGMRKLNIQNFKTGLKELIRDILKIGEFVVFQERSYVTVKGLMILRSSDSISYGELPTLLEYAINLDKRREYDMQLGSAPEATTLADKIEARSTGSAPIRSKNKANVSTGEMDV